MSAEHGNGSHVTRAELAAHMRRIDETLNYLREGMDELRSTQKQRNAWVSDRAAAMLDRLLPAGLGALGAYLASRFLHRP